MRGLMTLYALLLVMLSFSAAHAVNVTVDATQCSPSVILDGQFVNGETLAVIDVTADTSHRVQVAPGGFPGFVTVSAAGVVSYDPGLEGTVFTGAGTNTLTIVAQPVTVDSTDLTGSALVTPLTNPFPAHTITYGLPAGTYRLQGSPGGVLPYVFEVDTTGVVSYDPMLEGTVMVGSGTSTIGLVGYPITVVSEQLDSLVFVTSLGLPAGHTVNYRLPVGTFPLQASPGGRLDLVDIRTRIIVQSDGVIDYDPAVDGLSLTGLGTNTVEVLPFPVTVDATGSTADVNLSFSLHVLAGNFDTFALPVGTYNVNATGFGNIGSFSLTSDGSCSADEFAFGAGVVEIACGGVCSDADGDGFGSPGGPACAAGAAEDCNDADAGIFPGALELPGNAIDEDCDGSLGACDPLIEWRNHGQYVRCVANEVGALVDAGELTEDQADDLIRDAARSNIGKR